MTTSMIVICYDITNGKLRRRPWDGQMTLWLNGTEDAADWPGLYKFTDSTDATLPTENDRWDFNKWRGITVMIRKNYATDAWSVRLEQNQPPWAISGRPTAFIRRRTEQSRWRADTQVKPTTTMRLWRAETRKRWPWKWDKIVDATEETRLLNSIRLKVG